MHIAYQDQRMPLPEELEVYLRLDESTEARVPTEVSGKNRTGVLGGVKAGQSGWIHGAYEFDGRFDTVSMTNYAGVVGTTDRTVAFWMKAASVQNPYATLVHWGDSGYGHALGSRWDIRLDRGRLRIEVQGGAAIGSQVVADDQWHHVAAVWAAGADPSIGDIICYIDGVEQVLTLTADQAVDTATADAFLLGNSPHDEFRHYTGLLDELTVWSRALRSTEIASLCQSGAVPLGERIVRTWTATDECGSSISSEQYITVADSEAPGLSVPPDRTLGLDESPAPVNTGFATATDDCDPTPRVSYRDQVHLEPSEPSLYLRMDDPSPAGRAIDASGHDRHGLIAGTPAGREGRRNRAYVFDGIRDDIVIPAYKGVTGTRDRTVAFWMKAGPQPHPYATMVHWGPTAAGHPGGSRWDIRLVEGRLRVEVQGAGSEGSSVLTDDRWHHIAVVWANDGTPNIGDVVLYVDGQPDPLFLTGDQVMHTIGEQMMMIGDSPKDDQRRFAGSMDELTVWDRALDAATVSALVVSTPPPPSIRITRTWVATDRNGQISFADQIIRLIGGLNDADGDGLNDFDEYLHRSDAHRGDTDGDGLGDGEEVHDYGANPTLADSDGDGMGDRWEIDHGANPGRDDALGDLDGDQLTNLREMLAGTDPRRADTDGDGVSDYAELHLSFSDPLRAEFSGQDRSVLTMLGSSSVGTRIGSWANIGDAIHCQSGQGQVSYELPVPEEGFYALDVHISQHENIQVLREFNVAVDVDGVSCGRQRIQAVQGQSGKGRFFLPALTAGSHRIGIRWVGSAIGDGSLQIDLLELVEVGGLDADDNGREDWIDHRLERILGPDQFPETSMVSPVCLEGESADPNLLRVVSLGETVTVHRAIQNGWYANVPLSPSNSTPLVISGENGAVALSQEVLWEALDIAHPPTNVVTIRVGDALLITVRSDAPLLDGDFTEVHPVGRVTIGVQGLTNYTTTAATPVPHVFDSPGTYRVSGSLDDGEQILTGRIVVQVIDGSFNGNPACLLAQPRTWECPDIPPHAVVEYDPRLHLSSWERPDGGLDFELTTYTTDPQIFLMRLGEGGPIMDHAQVRALQYASTASTSVKVIHRYPDGSELVEVSIALSDIPPDLEIHLHIFVGGVLFDDGTIDRIVTAGDFDELGQYTYRLVKANNVSTSVCHTTRLYQDGAFVGTP